MAKYLDYCITTERYNYLLWGQRRIRNDARKNPGELTWDLLGFYGKLEHLAHDLPEFEVRNQDMDARAEDLAQALREARDRITQIVTDKYEALCVDD